MARHINDIFIVDGNGEVFWQLHVQVTNHHQVKGDIIHSSGLHGDVVAAGIQRHHCVLLYLLLHHQLPSGLHRVVTTGREACDKEQRGGECGQPIQGFHGKNTPDNVLLLENGESAPSLKPLALYTKIIHLSILYLVNYNESKYVFRTPKFHLILPKCS